MNAAQNALAVVQARMSSTRLPGKVIADVCGEPMLALLLKRLARSRRIRRIVVATSTDPGDDVIEEIATALGHDAYRGSRDDVLARFVGAAAGHHGPVVRITADCPLIDAVIVDEVIALFGATSGCEYASNIEPRTYPDGLDVEVFSPKALSVAAALAVDSDDREHVTAVMRRDQQRFGSVSLVREESLGDLRWTVDTADDLAFVTEVVRRLGSDRYTAGMSEILEAVRQEPSFADLNGRRG
jgi:spore coat polysaccharide biosynthesis protein SpsF (cytidylyltransferase family)